MFDPQAAARTPTISIQREDRAISFLLGQGLHECLGRAIASVMIPENRAAELNVLNGLTTGAGGLQRAALCRKAWEMDLGVAFYRPSVSSPKVNALHILVVGPVPWTALPETVRPGLQDHRRNQATLQRQFPPPVRPVAG